MTRMTDVRPGEKAKVVHVGVKGAAGRRYREMGLARGERIKVIRVAPLGDPIEIELKGYNLSLRKDEAKLIIVEVIR